MGITRITSQTGTNSTSNLTVAVGDLCLAWSFRDGSATPPALVAGWTNINTIVGTSCSGRLSFIIATSTSQASGTHTNATKVQIVAWRNAAVGASAFNAGVSTTFNYAALTFEEPDGTSWGAGFIGSRDGTNTTVPNVQVAPTGMTNITSFKDTTDAAGAHDTNGVVSSLSSQNVATGVASTGWCSAVVELIDQTLPGTFFGYSTTGSLIIGTLASNTIMGCKFTAPIGGGTITRIWTLIKSTGSSVYKNCLYSDNAGNPNVDLVESDVGNMGLWYVWRKTSLSYAFTGGVTYQIAMIANDNYLVKCDTGSTGQQFQKDGQTYPTFQSPVDTSTVFSQQALKANFIIEYTPAAGSINNNSLLLLSVGS